MVSVRQKTTTDGKRWGARHRLARVRMQARTRKVLWVCVSDADVAGSWWFAEEAFRLVLRLGHIILSPRFGL